MTEKQFERKVRSLAATSRKTVVTECLRLFNAGAVDVGEYGDDYELPKTILIVALEHCAAGLHPFGEANKRTLANLRKF